MKNPFLALAKRIRAEGLTPAREEKSYITELETRVEELERALDVACEMGGYCPKCVFGVTLGVLCTRCAQ